MDRLPAVIAALALAACEADSGGAPRSRVDKVAADPAKRAAAADGFCDVRFADAAGAPRFAMPALAGGAPPAADGWRWINVWATWCKPCVEEMPRLLRWRDRLAADGHPVRLIFVSADASDAEVARFGADRPELELGARLADADALPAWLAELGLDRGAPIPVHVLVDPAGKTRCVRAAAVTERDYPVVSELLATRP